MAVETVLAGILFATLSGGGLVNIQFQVKLMIILILPGDI